MAPRISSDEVATIIFSSGSTGDPKGVELTHGNVLSNAQSFLQLMALEEEDGVLGSLDAVESERLEIDHLEIGWFAIGGDGGAAPDRTAPRGTRACSGTPGEHDRGARDDSGGPRKIDDSEQRGQHYLM